MTPPTNTPPSKSSTPPVDLYAKLLNRAESRKSSYLNYVPTRPCDDHLRHSFEQALIHDGMSVSAAFAIPLRPPANPVKHKATRCRPFSSSRHMASGDLPHKSSRMLRAVTRAASRSDDPAQITILDTQRSTESSSTDDYALQIVKKDTKQAEASPGRTRVCKSVSSPAKRQDPVIDLEIVPTKVGGTKQRKRKRGDIEHLKEGSSLSEGSKGGREVTEVIQVEDESINLDGDDQPQVSRAHNAQVVTRKKNSGGKGAEQGRLRTTNPRRTHGGASQVAHVSSPRGSSLAAMPGQKRKSDQIMSRKSPPQVSQPPTKAPRLTKSKLSRHSSPSATILGSTPHPTPRQAKLQSETRQGQATGGLQPRPPTSTPLITSLRSATQFHHNVPKTSANISNPSNPTKNDSAPHDGTPAADASVNGSPGPAHAPRIASVNARTGTGLHFANRERERQSLPFRSRSAGFGTAPCGSSPSHSYRSPLGKPTAENKALGFRKVVTKPGPSSGADHRKLGEVTAPNCGGPKGFNPNRDSTHVTRSHPDVDKGEIRDTALFSRSPSTPDKQRVWKPSTFFANSNNPTSTARTDVSRTELREQNYDPPKLLTSRAKQAVKVAPGAGTPSPKNNRVPIGGTNVEKSAAASSPGKFETIRGSKSPLSNSNPEVRRAFTPVRAGAATPGEEGRKLGTPIRRRLMLNARRGGSTERRTSSASVPLSFAEKWSKKAELLLNRQKQRGNEADGSWFNAIPVRHDRGSREKMVSEGASMSQSKPVLDARGAEKEVRKNKPIQPRRMPPFQPVRRRGDRRQSNPAASLTLPVTHDNKRLEVMSEMQTGPLEKLATQGAVSPRVEGTQISPSPKKRERGKEGSNDNIFAKYTPESASVASRREEYLTTSMGPRRKGNVSPIQETLFPNSEGRMPLTSRDLSEGLREIKLTSPANASPSCEAQRSQYEITGSSIVGKGVSVDGNSGRFRQRPSPMMAAHPFAQKYLHNGEDVEGCSPYVMVEKIGSSVGQIARLEVGMEHVPDDSEQLGS